MAVDSLFDEYEHDPILDIPSGKDIVLPDDWTDTGGDSVGNIPLYDDEVGSDYDDLLMGDDEVIVGALFGVKARRRRRERRKRRRARRKRRWKRIGRGLKKVGKGLKKAVQSKAVQGLASAAAFVYPPVGVPLKAALGAANKILDGVDAGNTNAKRLVTNTALASKKGNVDARRGLQLLAMAKKARKAKGRPGKDFESQKAKLAAYLQAKKAQQDKLKTKKKRADFVRMAEALKKAKAQGFSAGKRAGQLQAIAAMRKKGRRGILMGKARVKHDTFVSVP